MKADFTIGGVPVIIADWVPKNPGFFILTRESAEYLKGLLEQHFRASGIWYQEKEKEKEDHASPEIETTERHAPEDQPANC